MTMKSTSHIESFMFLRQPLSLLGLSIILIGGCSSSSNKVIESLQTKILEDVVGQGGSSLQSVVCPADQQKADSFTCTGILASGKGFDIPVKSQAGENYTWEIVSINGLQNMSQLQSAIQSGLTAELGNATIDCGTSSTYKVAKPGEQFECKVEGTKPADAAKQTEPPESGDAAKLAKTPSSKKSGNVMVTIASSGDISWQQVVPEPKGGTKDTPKLPPPDANSAKSNSTATPASADTPSKASPDDSTAAPPTTVPASTAESALDAADALDKLED
jgi:hypothetical protein